MEWASALVTASDWLLVVAPLVFVIYYSVTAKWWKNIVGRSIVTLMVTIALIPSSKLMALIMGLSATSVTYRWLEVATHFPAIGGILGCCYALFKVRSTYGSLGNRDEGENE